MVAQQNLLKAAPCATALTLPRHVQEFHTHYLRIKGELPAERMWGACLVRTIANGWEANYGGHIGNTAQLGYGRSFVACRWSGQ